MQFSRLAFFCTCSSRVEPGCSASCRSSLIVAIFYFLVFMPMQQQKKQQAQMLADLQNGNECSPPAASSAPS